MNKSEYSVYRRLQRDECNVYRNGWPDFLAVTPEGKLRFIEVKTKNCDLSPAQRAMHEALRAAGCDVETIYVDSYEVTPLVPSVTILPPSEQALQWVEGLHRRGIEIRVFNGRIRFYPEHKYKQQTDEELLFLRHNRDDIKTALAYYGHKVIHQQYTCKVCARVCDSIYFGLKVCGVECLTEYKRRPRYYDVERELLAIERELERRASQTLPRPLRVSLEHESVESLDPA